MQVFECVMQHIIQLWSASLCLHYMNGVKYVLGPLHEHQILNIAKAVTVSTLTCMLVHHRSLIVCGRFQEFCF